MVIAVHICTCNCFKCKQYAITCVSGGCKWTGGGGGGGGRDQTNHKTIVEKSTYEKTTVVLGKKRLCITYMVWDDCILTEKCHGSN